MKDYPSIDMPKALANERAPGIIGRSHFCRLLWPPYADLHARLAHPACGTHGLVLTSNAETRLEASDDWTRKPRGAAVKFRRAGVIRVGVIVMTCSRLGSLANGKDSVGVSICVVFASRLEQFDTRFVERRLMKYEPRPKALIFAFYLYFLPFPRRCGQRMLSKDGKEDEKDRYKCPQKCYLCRR